MTEHPTITILMATYNGARHIREQLDSIIAQSDAHWQLFIRDDGSSDDTVAIVKAYEQQDSRISFIHTESPYKGACANFSALYAWAKVNVNPDYLMFADQDDIWHPQKIEKTYNALKAAEAGQPNEPIMVYTHLYMITDDGKPINDEFTLLPNLSFNITLAQNYALGCTTMINRPLMELMPEIPAWAENHDYWVALVASSMGKCVFVNEKLMQYRQHGANVTSQGSSFNKRFNRFTTGLSKQASTLKKRIVMLKGFLQSYQHQLSAVNKQMLTAYIDGFRTNWFNLARTVKKYRIRKLNLLQDLGFLFVTARYYRELKQVAKG